MTDATKEILAHWDGASIMQALVPKARGVGFLKVPAGHHANERITALEEAAGESIFGLDGALEVDVPSRTSADGRRRAWDGFLEGLARLYPYPVRIVESDEFWASHPIKGSFDSAGPRLPR